MLYQYCPNHILIAFQSRFFTKLTSGYIFLFFRVAAAKKLSPMTFCRFFLYNGVSSSVSVLVSSLSVVTSPYVFNP